ncbi:hypothetical protein [Sphingomonas faeni]|uniref:hypothetical protein n=1 Tax=Sphingomonas faeni TaxID=185950 RepID=UPI0020C78D85|nr:hypothetical protein [Sphingomonas faeni]MCP8889944.1 hypothetical protein [Sphingomonas faeni]
MADARQSDGMYHIGSRAVQAASGNCPRCRDMARMTRRQDTVLSAALRDSATGEAAPQPKAIPCEIC